MFIVCNYLCINTITIFCFHFFLISLYGIIQFMNMIPGNRISFMCHYYSQNHCQEQLEFLECNHFSNVLCLRVSNVTYKGSLKRHIIDNNTMNLLWTIWVDMPLYWSYNYLCCIEEVSLYSDDQCKWFDVRLLHLQCINNDNECGALSGWTCSLGFGEDCWHPGTVQGYQYLSQDSGYGRTQWWVAGPGLCLGVLLSPCEQALLLC